MFDEMREEEHDHRASLIEHVPGAFGEHIPLIRRQDVKGFVQRKPVWLSRPLGINVVRKQAEIMELETRRFYERALRADHGRRHSQAARRSAATEQEHYGAGGELEEQPDTRCRKAGGGGAAAARSFCRSSSPGSRDSWTARSRRSRRVFAAAFATRNSSRTRSSSVWRRRSARASRWASPRRSRTTDR